MLRALVGAKPGLSLCIASTVYYLVRSCLSLYQGFLRRLVRTWSSSLVLDPGGSKLYSTAMSQGYHSKNKQAIAIRYPSNTQDVCMSLRTMICAEVVTSVGS